MKGLVKQWAVLAAVVMLAALASGREVDLTIDYQLAYKLLRQTTVNGTTTERDAFVRLMNNTIQESPQFCSKVYTDLWGSSDHFPYYETSDGESIARFIKADRPGAQNDVMMCVESSVRKDSGSSYYSCSASQGSRQLCTMPDVSKRYSLEYFGALFRVSACILDGRYVPCTQATAPAGRMAGEVLKMRNFTLVKRECPPELVIGVKMAGGEVQGCNHTIDGSMVFAPAIGVVISFQYEEIWSVAATHDGDRYHFFMNTTAEQHGQFKKRVPEDVCVPPTCDDLAVNRLDSPAMVFPEEDIDDAMNSGKWYPSSELVKRAYTEALVELLLPPTIARDVLFGES